MSDEIRVPLVEPGTRPELADLERSILAARGRISPLYQALLNSPPIASSWEKLLTAVRNQTLVPGNLRELIILRIAVLNRASFEFDAHVPHALKAGLPQSKIEAVRSWQPGRGHDKTINAFDDDELLVLELADAMTRDIDVPDALIGRVRARFDARGIVEVVATVAAYNMVSRLLVAINLVHRP
ncbi:MAG TPA: carboxymuconolactone decarboxylase family protein [Casimicrobiaceae bacterium]